MVDNTTAESIIREMGTSHSSKLNQLVKQIWQWCESQKIWITMAHIPGVENCQADFQSLSFNWGTEWCLNKDILTLACNMLRFTPDIDLFASRINHQFKPYVAFRPDPEAIAINAFHMTWAQFAFYAFPPFSVIMQVLQKIQEDQASGILVIPYWPTQIWWPKAMNMVVQQPNSFAKKQGTIIPPQPTQRDTPHVSKALPADMPLVGDQLKKQGFSDTASRVIQNSWRTGTKKQYACHIKRWICYCSKRDINPICPDVRDGINFLAELLDSGVGYSSINTAQCALSSITNMSDHFSFGTHPLVSRFLKGVFTERPSLPRYQDIWDMNIVLNHLKQSKIAKELSLKDLTLKLVMLMALLSGQRCQTPKQKTRSAV
ncbi:Hypothetical predicted protein [Paramuricea clavata]|uniref:Uncharacterized protein n=1 Tax=Paramuricea clavata TaxID=317549 RepID=A0A7D9EQU9_PARCT|nr:Hypothetical predicted protein [Paramuricea clavata]